MSPGAVAASSTIQMEEEDSEARDERLRSHEKLKAFWQQLNSQ